MGVPERGLDRIERDVAKPFGTKVGGEFPEWRDRNDGQTFAVARAGGPTGNSGLTCASGQTRAKGLIDVASIDLGSDDEFGPRIDEDDGQARVAGGTGERRRGLGKSLRIRKDEAR